MLEILGTGLLGSLLGGLFRLAPEVLKLFDKVQDRKHELSMFQIQTDLEKQRGDLLVTEKYVDHGVHQLDAIQAAFKEQAASSASSYKWVMALSALVRPIITYVLFALYVSVKISIIAYSLNQGASWGSVLQAGWAAEDFAMLNMILTFWFVGRSIEKYQK